jgi:topoisomerase-4 subunit B
MRGLIEGGHLYLAMPPLYRLSQGAKTFYARDEAHKDELLRKDFNGKGKVDVSRFKGLGEMLPRQLKDTTMDRATRTLLRVEIADDDKSTGKLVDQLMGNKPEARFRFIQERAEFAKPDELDI